MRGAVAQMQGRQVPRPAGAGHVLAELHFWSCTSLVYRCCTGDTRQVGVAATAASVQQQRWVQSWPCRRGSACSRKLGRRLFPPESAILCCRGLAVWACPCADIDQHWLRAPARCNRPAAAPGQRQPARPAGAVPLFQALCRASGRTDHHLRATRFPISSAAQQERPQRPDSPSPSRSRLLKGSRPARWWCWRRPS